MNSPVTVHVDPLYADWQEPYELAILAAERDLGSIYARKEDRDAFLHAVWRHFRRVPKLQGCTAVSIRAALVDLALSGLDITQRGEVWLLPFENVKKDPVTGKTQYKNNQALKELECQVQDGYLGRIKLARAHPDIQDAWGRAVRQHDEYQYNGSHALPVHKHPPSFAPRGSIIGVYACVTFRNGTAKCLEMSLAEVLAHRDQYSRAGQSEVWQENLSEWQEYNGRRQRVQTATENRSFELMAIKTITNKLCHPREIPMTRHAQRILATQEAVEAFLKPPTPEDKELKTPVAAVDNTGLLFGDSPFRQESPWHDASRARLLEAIQDDFYRILPLLPPAEASQQAVRALLMHCFGVEDWPAVAIQPATAIQAALPRWRAAVTQVHQGIPDTLSADADGAGWRDFFAIAPVTPPAPSGPQPAPHVPPGISQDDWETARTHFQQIWQQTGHPLRDQPSWLRDNFGHGTSSFTIRDMTPTQLREAAERLAEDWLNTPEEGDPQQPSLLAPRQED